ncbi:hypothetical protein CHU92_09720 [Flavobacterium cyanobacteriorum]|uniref:Uncharacterized protein n=1 Tax=Flavobacterium cyanobacteriorum TaxID=2022802 RepID=A0A255Z4I2_9FLAO|nr:hypothetical protein [Flavobacterium cyanobacteriorum]OYQ36366.1 hypothetical protein CHU92_09720 [Flavobacterium cyanobacteriorum]
MFYRLFYAGKDIGYQPRFRGQTFYLFLIFFIISLGILFLLPTAIAVLLNVVNQDQWLKGLLEDRLNYETLEKALKIIINFTALIILIFPAINNSIISLACEFVSASNYLERGRNKQKIHGQMDILVEKIVEEEGDNSEIYFHSYSFGTLICLDYIFPFGLKPTTRLHKHLRGLITIGCPMEFIKVYFPKFLTGRNIILNDNIKWINIYSLADALGSNFRKQNDEGPAEYSFQSNTIKPINIQYEVTNANMNVITQFFTLHALKAHSSYWDNEDDGQNCFRDLIPIMKDNDLL